MVDYDRLNEVFDCCGVDLRNIITDLGLQRGDIIHTGHIMDRYNINFPTAYKLLEALRYCGITRKPDIYKREQFDMVICNPLQKVKPFQITPIISAIERVLLTDRPDQTRQTLVV